MADRGRDLKIGILSDVSRFDLDAPARDLEKVGRAADAAGRDLSDLDDNARKVDLDRLGTEARDAARKMDGAFDAIARSSKTAAKKVDDDGDTMKRSLGDVGGEAQDTAREMAASFSGSSEDILDAFQELGANAGVAFGPIGAAAGIAATVGVGMIRAQAEKLKQMTSDLVQEMIDAGGRLTEEAIQNRINTMAVEDPAGLLKYDTAARQLGISLSDITRARAGDADALKRVIGRLDELDDAQRKEARSAGNQVAQRSRASEALAGLRAELGLTARATEAAEAAVSRATSASSKSVQQSSKSGQASWDDLRANLGRPIKARVVAEQPSASEIAAVRSGIMRAIGTIPVQLRVSGQNIHTNNANNDRYRW